jgi:hypothetical protein
MNTTQETPKLLPFNLERALAGDPVVYRDGTPVIEVTRFKSGNVLKPVISLANRGVTVSHYETGTVYVAVASGHDLFMAAKTKTKKVWVNLYGDMYRINSGSAVYETKSEAESSHLHSDHDDLPYLTTVEVEVLA